MDFYRAALAEVVAMPFAPLAVTHSKADEDHASHTVRMTEGRGKTLTFPCKEGVVSVKAANRQQLRSDCRPYGQGFQTERWHRDRSGPEGRCSSSPRLGAQPLLPVQRFWLHSNRIHGSMLAQFYPVVWTAAGGSAKDTVG